MSFNTALSGLQAASSDLQVIGNNVANTSTPGFKKARAEFADVYAASNLGVSATAIGTGTALTKVSQQFNQGTINFTENSLDLAANGQGFFVLNDGGTRVYSRAGSFGLDKDGNIVNASSQKLVGFLSDGNGNITGAQGDIKIDTANLSPKATADVNMQVNLDATSKAPSVAFVADFTPTTPPDPNSYNSSTSTTIYDSLGNSHIMTNYFVKAQRSNEWRIFVGIDGTGVNPTAATPPVGTPPQPFTVGEIAQPFTLSFSDSGALIANNPSAPPQYYGPGPITSSAPALSDAGTVGTIGLGELTINGVDIPPIATGDDVFSTSDPLGSTIAIAAAINKKTPEHGVSAVVNATTLDLGSFTVGDLTAGDLTINGRQIAGTISNNTQLLSLINAETAITGVSAADIAGSIVLTAANGRNIQTQTDGTTISNATFANLDLNGGSALDKVQRGTISLSANNNLGITVGGTNPGDAGLSVGPLAGIIQTNSDIISLTGWNPGGGAQGPQTIDITLTGATQFGSPFSINSLTQDGFTTGRLSSVDVASTGVVSARYTNGQSQQLGQVALANFGNVQGLQPVGDTAWSETFDSGAALIGTPGSSSLGLIQSGALEDSNVQLTQELVAMIVAQRNFQANAQTIKTSSAVTDTIINIR